MILNVAAHKMSTTRSHDQSCLQYTVCQTSFLTNTIMKVCLVPDEDSFPSYKVGQYCKLEGADGTFRSFSVVNQPNSMGEIELHIRFPKKNEGIARQLIVGRKFGLIGPCGKEKKCINNLSSLLISEGVGLAAMSQLVLSGTFSPSNSMIIWLGKPTDLRYLEYMSGTWLEKFPGLLIKNVALDKKKLIRTAFNYYQNVRGLSCYFSGSPKLKEYIEQNFIKAINDIPRRISFVTDF